MGSTYSPCALNQQQLQKRGALVGALHSHPLSDAAEEPETLEVLLVRMSGSVLAALKSIGLQLGVNIFLSRPNGPALCA